MIAAAGQRISDIFRRTCPDPFVLAILLTIVTAAWALLFGEIDVPDGYRSGIVGRAAGLVEAWGSDSAGLWRLLAFGMQMCLILITGYALAVTKPVAWLIDRLAQLPRSTASAALLVGLVAGITGVVNWGLGLIIGALLALKVGEALHRRGVRAHYPLICAAGYLGLLVWHGGFSGSAPLSMTTLDGAAKVLPAEYIERMRADNIEAGRDEQIGIPLSETVFSRLNVMTTGGLLLGGPMLLMLMAPKREDDIRPITRYRADIVEVGSDDQLEDDVSGGPIPNFLDNSPLLVVLLAAPLAWWVIMGGIERIGLNQVNAAMLALGLVLHGSPRSYVKAVEEGVRGCAGIILQFPLYGGIMGIMAAAGLIASVANTFAAIGNQTTMPILSMFSAALVNLFVPSGGGQWAIQGPIALETGLTAGVTPGRMVMSVAYGDQLTNMLQPFWALPLLGITGVKARDIVGYTAVVMIAAIVWVMFCLLVI